DRIELYTGPYAHAHEQGDHSASLQQFAQASSFAASIGLGVNAGHDLNLKNLSVFRQALPDLQEVSIGHAFTVDAIELGLKNCIAAYQQCLGK
ncbi:pyridoxine 5'-phosphate synthase, partial [Litorivivens sp.]